MQMENQNNPKGKKDDGGLLFHQLRKLINIVVSIISKEL